MNKPLLLLTIVLSGCASAFMRGATTASRPPAKSIARYTVSQCTDLTKNESIRLPSPITYHLAEEPEGLVLYEFDASGNGAKITNTWMKEDGADVFFMWVGTSHGFQFVLDRDRAQGGTRLVHLKGTFKSYPENGISKVSGDPQVSCPMKAGT